MGDRRLRDAERRWTQTASVEDEAAWLLERARAGELDSERLGLAAYCGHRAAVIATGAVPAVEESLRTVLIGLGSISPRAGLLVGSATASLALPFTSGTISTSARDLCRQLGDFVERPTFDAASAIRDAVGAFRSAIPWSEDVETRAWIGACVAIGHAALCAWDHVAPLRGSSLALERARRAVGVLLGHATDAAPGWILPLATEWPLRHHLLGHIRTWALSHPEAGSGA